MLSGTVKYYNEKKGFGMIIADDSLQEIFVHATGLVEQVKEEDRVMFILTEGGGGKSAINVKKISQN